MMGGRTAGTAGTNKMKHLLTTLAAALLSVEMTMGPVAMTLPQTAWWLGLPVRRRGFIQPGFLKSLLWPTIAAMLVVLPMALGMASSPTPGCRCS